MISVKNLYSNVVKKESHIISSLLVAYSVITVHCSKDEGMFLPENETTGSIALSLMVIPAEIKSAQGLFVTLSGVKFDNILLKGFIKQTIELSAYQEGDIKFIFNGKVEPKSYSSITLIFDNDSDASGDAEGCYILTDKNNKNPLRISEDTMGEVTLKKEFVVDSESPTEIVIDFDIRKTIGLIDSTRNIYENRIFINPESFKNFRIVSKKECGEIKGYINRPFHLSGNMYVFVYRKGGFDYFVETQKYGRNKTLFANAIVSSKVKAYGSYQLSLLEKGNYEIHIATYDDNNEKVFLFKGKINPTSNISGILLNNISVLPKSQIQLNIDILGVI